MATETTFRLVALILFLTVFSISAYYRWRANQQGDRISLAEEGFWILNLRRILALSLWGSMLAYLINPDWIAWGRLDLPAGIRWLGAGLLLLAAPLAYWVFSSLGNNVTPTVVTRKVHTLVTWGPYRWVRHPLYSMGILAFTGFSLLSGSWFTLLVMGLGFVVISRRTDIEESLLVERFGDDYRAYMQRTGRFLPRLLRKTI